MKDNKTMKTTSESSPKPPEGSRRLRKGGLSRTMLKATAVAGASTALMTANADIIYSGSQNLSTSSTAQPEFVDDNNPVNIDGSGANEFILNSFNGKGSDFHLFFFSSPDFSLALGNNLSQTYLVHALASGVEIGPGMAFDAPFTSSGKVVIENIPNDDWMAGSDAYFGFRFNPSGSQMLYGWGNLTISADATVMTLVDWAYENTGVSITTGAVPEPTTGTLALSGLAAAAILRKRPKATS